ncbi:MAG: ABC transporter permease, partial [Bacteroidales bacterium]|nr:ABC transporter permease [Bacteroidales bacterium]
MNGIKYIIKKELTRVFSDKKLIISLFILPVVILCGMYIFIGKMQTSMINDIEQHISTIYLQNTPEGFQEAISSLNYDADIKYIEATMETETIKEGILKGDIDLLVVFEDNFLNNIKAYEDGGVIPEVKTYYNNSEEYSDSARANFVSQVLDVYRQQLLAERFLDLDQLTIFQIDKDPQSSIIVDNEKATGKLFGT